MTVQTQVSKVTTGAGNGVATTWSFSPVVVYEEENIQVTLIETSSGDETPLALGTGSANFSVNVSLYPGTGSITYPANENIPMPSTHHLVIKSVLTLEQQTNLENQGGYNPDTLEQALDKSIKIDQQQQEELDRAMKLPIASDASAELPFPVALRYVRWNAAADGLENVAFIANDDDLTVSPFGESLIDDADGDTALSTLGVSTFAKTILDDVSASDARDTLEVAQQNRVATTDPTVGDDNLDGYSVGSIWVNVTSDNAWVCLDTSTGAAVWRHITLSGADGTSLRGGGVGSDPSFVAGAMEVVEYADLTNGGANDISSYTFDTDHETGYVYHYHFRKIKSAQANWVPEFAINGVGGASAYIGSWQAASVTGLANVASDSWPLMNYNAFPGMTANTAKLSGVISVFGAADSSIETTILGMATWGESATCIGAQISGVRATSAADINARIGLDAGDDMTGGEVYVFRQKEIA